MSTTSKSAAAEKPKKLTPRQQSMARKAAEGGYKDANFDGVADVDPLSRQEMAAQYQSALGLIYSVPEITKIFDEAVKGQWNTAKFNAAVQNSNWYQNNNEYFRKAWASEHFGMENGKPSADWQASMQNARMAVQSAAADMGSQITPEETDALARRYLYEGWGDSGRQQLMAQALAEGIKYLPDGRGETLAGKAGNLSDDLRSIASANGLTYSDNWYLTAARSVASGLKTGDDFAREIRDQAASMWQPYAERIRSGSNAYDLASPYINTMAQELEMSPGAITLNDPYVRQAMADGTSLWEFTQKIRNDPRWEKTAKAQNEITGVAGNILQMFGLMGG